MLTPREKKNPSTGISEESRTRDAAASPEHYRLSYFGPAESISLDQRGGDSSGIQDSEDTPHVTFLELH